MNPEEIDLRALTQALKGSLNPGEPVGYLRGKALMRDLLVQTRGYSQLEAEELVDTLESRGFLHFLGDTAERSEADSRWSIEAEPR